MGLQVTPNCDGHVVSGRTGEAFACERVADHPGEHVSLRARTFLVFDTTRQRVHLDRCGCSFAKMTDDGVDTCVDVGGVTEVTRDEIADLLDSEGGPSTFSVARCVAELM